MARLIAWLMVNLSRRQRRQLLLGAFVGEIVLVSIAFAVAGMPRVALYALAAALVTLFIGIWRERLLHSN